MATVKATGNINNILSSTTETSDLLGSQFTDNLVDWYNSFFDSYYDIYYGNGSIISQSNTQLYGYLNTAHGYITLNGSGFNGTSGSISSINFNAINGLNWTMNGGGKWSAANGLSLSGSVSRLELWTDSGSSRFIVEGRFKPDEYQGVTGSFSKVTTIYDGITSVELGTFKLGDVAGSSYKELSKSDSMGSLTITENLPVSTVNALSAGIDNTGDIFDESSLFSGNDVFEVSANARTWYGFAGNDKMTGGSLDDSLDGGEGNDTITGNAGDDELSGGAGDDKIDGGDGGDSIFGGSGKDKITAGEGDNTVDAGDGDNKVTAGAGDDEITAGSGKDKITAGEGDNTVDAGDGDNKVTAGAGDDEITAGSGKDKITAGDGNNTVDAGDGANTVTTGMGDDKIVTGTGSDAIKAGAGADLVDAGKGVNKVDLGSDLDSDQILLSEDFWNAVLALSNNSAAEKVSTAVTNFNTNDELWIDLDALGLDSADVLIADGASINDVGGYNLIMDTQSGKLYYDTDGTGVGAGALLVATFKGTALDFGLSVYSDGWIV